MSSKDIWRLYQSERAATDEDIQPDATYRMSGNRIGATTLDLDRPFEEIRAQLDGIAESLTGPSTPAS